MDSAWVGWEKRQRTYYRPGAGIADGGQIRREILAAVNAGKI